jgi:hypothetical protein
MAPFTKRPAQEAQQLVRCYVDVAGDYDGEDHEPGEWIYLDERHAWELQRCRKVRIASFEEAASVAKAEQRAGVRRRAGRASRWTWGCRGRIED